MLPWELIYDLIERTNNHAHSVVHPGCVLQWVGRAVGWISWTVGWVVMVRPFLHFSPWRQVIWSPSPTLISDYCVPGPNSYGMISWACLDMFFSLLPAEKHKACQTVWFFHASVGRRFVCAPGFALWRKNRGSQEKSQFLSPPLDSIGLTRAAEANTPHILICSYIACSSPVLFTVNNMFSPHSKAKQCHI
jgi:hypothetical protein